MSQIISESKNFLRIADSFSKMIALIKMDEYLSPLGENLNQRDSDGVVEEIF